MSGVDWDEIVDRHLARQAVERGLSRHSLEAYGRDLRDFQDWCRAQELRPAAFDAAALTAYLETLADRGLAVASQRRHLASLRGLGRELVDREIIERDPAPAIKLRPHPRKLPRTLSRHDLGTLLDVIDTSTTRGLRDRAMLELAYSCGLRVSELVGLQQHQVNVPAQVVIVLGKGNKERMVPIGGAALRALKAYLDARRNEESAAANAANRNGPARRSAARRTPARRTLARVRRRCSSRGWGAR